MVAVSAPFLTHASCVAVGGHAVVLSGPSGAGKSDLALRLIGEGGVLVADDQVALEKEGGFLFASPPPALAGVIEARGIGILRGLPFARRVPVRLIVGLVAAEDAPPERMPEAVVRSLLGVSLPFFRLFPFEASTPVKIRLLLQGHGPHDE